ncbi:MAG: polysaccharide biosynthesis protein [SAR324 cluster bacterium]|nr:polysaccharide biosynthesis protein [SAR324 cluster bacterium]
MNAILNKIYPHLSRSAKTRILLTLDIGIFLLSICGAFSLRFDTFFISALVVEYWVLVVVISPLKAIVFYAMRMYRPILRYSGLELLYTAIKAVVFSSGLLVLLAFFLQFSQFPRSILLIDAVLTFTCVVGLRVFMRWMAYDYIQQSSRKTVERVIIYGAGAAGSQLADALLHERQHQIIAFVDDNPQLRKQNIKGIVVYSPQELLGLIEEYEVKSILLAIPSATRNQRREIVKTLQELGVSIKTVPGLGEIVAGKVTMSDIRNIDIIDLLGRKEVLPDPLLLHQNIRNKTVLVTGAGGSIGSELCRQIAQQSPQKLILYEWNEWALYSIDMELAETYPELQRIACLGSVTDSNNLIQVLRRYSVDTIYHAAAYKHVPLVEANAAQGVLNTVMGTLSTAQAAVACGVKTFVLISTDKAVRPTSVMGATKRVSELILQALSHQSGHDTCFVMVRFGNVLDSAGSVVPRFRKQILEGGPLTVTHPEITRYFMSIPEASRLVIQAGAMGTGGEVFLLDMGEPVKIYDLAVQMIELSGLSVGKDIQIQTTGLRPGEKLYEELLINGDNAMKTQHPKIYSSRETMVPGQKLFPLLEQLFEAARQDNTVAIIQFLKLLIPEYTPPLDPVELKIPHNQTSSAAVVVATTSKIVEREEVSSLKRHMLLPPNEEAKVAS